MNYATTLPLKFGDMTTLECPICGEPAGRPSLLEVFDAGKDARRISLNINSGWVETSGTGGPEYEAGIGKPPVNGPGFTVKVDCEMGHSYRLAIGFHKGHLLLIPGAESVTW